MARRTIDITRRQVLRGAGGVTLALPFLPSLEARALGDPVYQGKRRFVSFRNGHGGAFETNMFPDPSLLTSRTNLFPDHTIAVGPLKATVNGGNAVLSPILTAKATTLTPALVGKMNVLYGLDGTSHFGHNSGAHLGNFAASGLPANAQTLRPTVDQFLAWSPTFYPDVSGIRQRAILLNDYNNGSYNYSQPSTRSGDVTKIKALPDNLKDVFTAVFGQGAGSATPAAPPRPVIDHVLQSYRALRNGNRRLSAADKQRLDDHVDRLTELQRQVNARPTCTNLTAPGENPNIYYGLNAVKGDPARALHDAKLYADLLVAALMCGASRIAVFPFNDGQPLTTYTAGDWHQDVAHQWFKPDRQAILAQSYQQLFEEVILYLAAKLDVEEAPGVTYLDNSLVVWSQECCMSTHDSTSLPVVTFGSGGHFLKTGLFADYRKTTDPKLKTVGFGSPFAQYPGLLYSQWLATLLQAMGIPPGEFERWGHRGYGYPYISPDEGPVFKAHYVDTSSRYFQMASDVLPFLKA